MLQWKMRFCGIVVFGKYLLLGKYNRICENEIGNAAN